jgi:hypothetical protein
MQRALVSEIGGKGVPEGTFLFAHGYLEKKAHAFLSIQVRSDWFECRGK